MKNFTFNFLTILLFSFSILMINACKKDSKETCSDGIQNQAETGVDCGGTCPDCPTCDDGIMNGNETGIDCGGGECEPCHCFDGVMSGDETGVDCGGSCEAACVVQITEHMTADIDGVAFAANLVAGNDVGGTLSFQSDQSQERQLFFDVPSGVALGTYDLVNTAGYSAEYKELFQGEYTTESGSMVITMHDTNAKLVSGTFEFVGVSYSFGNPVDTATVTNGSFTVEYN